MVQQSPAATPAHADTRTRKILVVGLIAVACALSLVAPILMATAVAHSLFGTMRLAGWLPMWAPIFMPLGIVASVVAAVAEFVALRLWRRDKSGGDAPSPTMREGMPERLIRALSTGLVCLMLVETVAAGVATAAPLSLPGSAVTSGSSASHPAHGTITVFPPIPGGVNSMVLGPDGNMWFLGAVTFGYITPAGSVHSFDYPNLTHHPSNLIVGPDHNLWFEGLAVSSNFPHDYVGKITADGKLIEYALPPAHSFPSLVNIVAGPDGNVWYARRDGLDNGRIGRISPSGTVKEYDVSSPVTDVGDIVAGPDGNLWFYYLETSLTYPIPQFAFGTVVGSGIGRITPSGAIQEYSLPSPYYPAGDPVVGSDGALWFAEINESTSVQGDKVQFATVGGKIGCITTGGSISQYALPTAGNSATNLVARPDKTIWFTEIHAAHVIQFSSSGTHSLDTIANGKVGKITSTGAISEYRSSAMNSGLTNLISGPDGNLWFTAIQGGNIGRITSAGAITEYSLRPSEIRPLILVAGTDQGIWFAAYVTRNETQTGYIGYIVP